MTTRLVVVLLVIALAVASAPRGDAAPLGVRGVVTAMIDGDLVAASGDPEALAEVGSLLIPTTAMSPTLAAGDQILVDRSAYRTASPARGDAIAFQLSAVTAAACGVSEGTVAVKRVVGVAGDAVSVGPGGVVVNGTTVVVAGARPPEHRRSFRPVPAGALLVIGDNGSSSCDSAIWPQPFLAGTDVVGRVEGVLAPRDHAGFLLPGGGVELRSPTGPLRARLDAILEIGRGNRALAERLQQPYICSIVVAGDCRRRLAASLGDVVRQERGRLRAHVAALAGDCGAGALRALRRDLGRDHRALLDPTRPLNRTVRALGVHGGRALVRVAACWQGAAGPAVGALR